MKWKKNRRVRASLEAMPVNIGMHGTEFKVLTEVCLLPMRGMKVYQEKIWLARKDAD